MSNDEAGGCVAALSACMMVALISVMCTHGCADGYWKAETVKRGHAEYNAQTGKWQWKGDAVLKAKDTP